MTTRAGILSHEFLMDFLKYRIKDSALLQLTKKFLKAGYVDSGLLVETEQGTPQGSILSLILANIFLHYEAGSPREQVCLPWVLSLLCPHAHWPFSSWSKTSRTNFTAKCKGMNQWLKEIRNKAKGKAWWPLLSVKLRGHFQYYGVSGNYPAIAAYCRRTLYSLCTWLNRRSQKRSMNWSQFYDYLNHYPLPKPRIVHNFYTGFPCHVSLAEEPDVGNPQVRFCEALLFLIMQRLMNPLTWD